MKKKILFFIITSFFILSLSFSTFGEELDEDYINVRIRSPRQENEYITISGNNDIEILVENNGQYKSIYNTGKKELNIKIDSYYNENTYYNEYNSKANIGPFHIILNDSYETYQEAEASLNNIKEDINLYTFIYFDSEKFYIAIGRYTTKNKAEEILANNLNQYKGKIENHKSKSILIYDKNNKLILSYKNNYKVLLKSQNENTIFFDGAEYCGNCSFYIIDDYKLISINKVSIEDYLKGVVPSEIPSSWPIEALKAQAVAARTYAKANSYNLNPYGYHVADNQNSQVYNALNYQCESTNKAIKDTRGELIYHNDNLITAFYHSTSGGKTANSANVWNDDLPYLQSKEDSFSNISPYTDWRIDLKEKQLIELLYDDYPADKIYDIKILKTSDDERVIETSIKTNTGEINLIKEEFRTVLGYGNIKSTWFKIEKNNQISILGENLKTKDNLAEKNYLTYKDKRAKSKKINYDQAISIKDLNTLKKISSSPDEFSIIGKGWGHGIGMSQYGAKQMAEEGYDYKQILEYYYTGVAIK